MLIWSASAPAKRRYTKWCWKPAPYEHKSAAIDLSGPLDEEGQFLYRLTGLANDEQDEINYVENKRQFIAPSLTWRPNDDTSLTLFRPIPER